ncbi:hypothetical protein Tco_1360601 [Tanacetum coccineum]
MNVGTSHTTDSDPLALMSNSFTSTDISLSHQTNPPNTSSSTTISLTQSQSDLEFLQRKPNRYLTNTLAYSRQSYKTSFLNKNQLRTSSHPRLKQPYKTQGIVQNVQVDRTEDRVKQCTWTGADVMGEPRTKWETNPGQARQVKSTTARVRSHSEKQHST